MLSIFFYKNMERMRNQNKQIVEHPLFLKWRENQGKFVNVPLNNFIKSHQIHEPSVDKLKLLKQVSLPQNLLRKMR